MKIRLFCPFCVFNPCHYWFFSLHQENVAIHFLYQVQLLRFIHLFIFCAFICLFSIFFFFLLTKNWQFCNFFFCVTFVYFFINGEIQLTYLLSLKSGLETRNPGPWDPGLWDPGLWDSGPWDLRTWDIGSWQPGP